MKWHRISFKYQLIGTFALVTLSAIVIVYALADWAIQDRFTQFRRHAALMQAQPLRRLLIGYYYRTGSWQGLPELLNPRLEELRVQLEQPLIVADDSGLVLVSSDETLLGRKLSGQDLSAGLPLWVGQKRVGTLLTGLPAGEPNPLEQQFSESVHNSILLAGALALIIALALGFFLIRRLAQPLTELRLVAEKISQGELEPRVSIKGSDELGRLGDAFNHMIENLQKSEELRRQLILDIAHELRNPLMVQQSHLELLVDNITEPNPQQLQTIYEQNLLLGRLVRDLQVLALADAGELHILRAPAPLGDILERIVAHVQPMVDEKAITLETAISEGLPTLSVDRHRIEQVLLNLLDNACRYTPAEGTIRLAAQQEGNEVHVSVLDQGPGIPPEDLPHLFERFYRGDKSRTRISGSSGLGLAIAKALMEAHGGRIWAEDAPSGGACLHFTLPCSPNA